jgi:hypothetical protein
MGEFIDWYCSEPRLALNRGVVLRYRLQLESQQLAPAKIGATRSSAFHLSKSAAQSLFLIGGVAALSPSHRLLAHPQAT